MKKEVLVLTVMTVITLSTAHTLAAESVGDVNTDMQIGGKTSVVAERAQSAKKTDSFYKLNEKVYFAQNYDANSQIYFMLQFTKQLDNTKNQTKETFVSHDAWLRENLGNGYSVRLGSLMYQVGEQLWMDGDDITGINAEYNKGNLHADILWAKNDPTTSDTTIGTSPQVLRIYHVEQKYGYDKLGLYGGQQGASHYTGIYATKYLNPTFAAVMDISKNTTNNKYAEKIGLRWGKPAKEERVGDTIYAVNYLRMDDNMYADNSYTYYDKYYVTDSTKKYDGFVGMDYKVTQVIGGRTKLSLEYGKGHPTAGSVKKESISETILKLSTSF